jgi:hypothetical protein
VSLNQKKYVWSNLTEVIASLSEIVGNTNGVFSYNDTFVQRRQWRKIAREIDVHAKGYLLPKVKELRPNEHSKSMENRLMKYEPITTPFWYEALVKMKRIILASSADVRINDKTADYIHGDNFDGLALYDYFAVKATEQVINNPNGLTCIYPFKYAEKYKTPLIGFIDWDNIVYINRDAVIYLSESESDINYTYTDTEKEGITYNTPRTRTVVKAVYHIFTVWGDFARVYDRSFDDKTKTGEWSFEAFKMPLKTMPCFQNGGIEVEPYVFKSFFHNAIGYGNKVLDTASDNDAVNAMHNYPKFAEMVDDCEATGCNRGKVTYTRPDGVTDFKNCDTCQGTGKMVVMSPYKGYAIPRPQNNTEPNAPNIPPLQYIAPPVDNLIHSGTVWKDHLEIFIKCLHVIGRKDTKAAESGASLEKQFEPLYDFMHNVGLTLYNNLELILKAIQGQLTPSDAPPSVTRPISYHLVEEQEAFTVLSTVLEKDMPIALRRQSIRNFISKYIGIKSPLLKFFEVLESIDPFLYYSHGQKAGLKNTGGMNGNQYRVSVAGFGVMVQLMNEEKYRDADSETIKNEILARVGAFEVDEVVNDKGVLNA